MRSEQHAVCVSGDGGRLGGWCADLGAMPRLWRGTVREIESSWALQLSTEIPHRFAPSATVGESGVFSLLVLLWEPVAGGSLGDPARTTVSPGGSPFLLGPTQRSDPGGSWSLLAGVEGGGVRYTV